MKVNLPEVRVQVKQPPLCLSVHAHIRPIGLQPLVMAAQQIVATVLCIISSYKHTKKTPSVISLTNTTGEESFQNDSLSLQFYIKSLFWV